MAKKLSEIRLHESEAVKRTQTNLKNIEASKTGYSADDEEYRKHIERMKKSRDEYLKNTPNTIYKRNEEFEQLDEVSMQKAREVHKARFDAVEKAKKSGNKDEFEKAKSKMSKAFGFVKRKDSQEMKKITDKLPKTPEGINKMYSDRYEYNKKMGYSNESVEVNEAEKMKGEDPCWKNYQMVGTKKKNGKEVPNCVPVSESRKANIVREAYMKAKSKKKNEENDKDVSGKVQKFESDPVLTDTIQKQ
jgi:hypothetical protein